MEKELLARLQDLHPNENVRNTPSRPLTKDGKTYFPLLLDKDGKQVASPGEGVSVFYDVPVPYAQALFVGDAHKRFHLIKVEGFAESVPVKYPGPHHTSEWKTITAGAVKSAPKPPKTEEAAKK